MTDDLTLDEGAGAKKAATDEVAAGRHIPWVKIASGTDNATDGAVVDASGNLQVEVTNGSIVGTAGTPNAGVLSVQGVGSGTTLPVTAAQATAANLKAEVVGTGTFAVQAAQATAASLNCTEASAAAIKTAAELIDDAVYVDDADWTDNTSKHILTGGLYQAAPHTVTDGDVSPMQVDVSGRTIVVGAAASDAASAGNPVLNGGKALAFGTAPTDVSADGDAVPLLATLGGRLYVETLHPVRWQTQHYETSAQTDHSLQAATGSNATSLYITDVIISNGATAGYVTLLDGQGGTELLRIICGINGGAVMNLVTPIKLTANVALCMTSVTVTTHAITVTGFTAAH